MVFSMKRFSFGHDVPFVFDAQHTNRLVKPLQADWILDSNGEYRRRKKHTDDAECACRGDYYRPTSESYALVGIRRHWDVFNVKCIREDCNILIHRQFKKTRVTKI